MDNNLLMCAFGMLANSLDGGGDIGQSFPLSDAQDLFNGANYIPEDVTLARRRGEKVIFHSESHEWEFSDGTIVK